VIAVCMAGVPRLILARARTGTCSSVLTVCR
jgi:hypothetical protein